MVLVSESCLDSRKSNALREREREREKERKRKREREREREKEREKERVVAREHGVSMYVCIYLIRYEYTAAQDSTRRVSAIQAHVRHRS